jgi:uncharacterized cupredoxin-like copper-binding protein
VPAGAVTFTVNNTGKEEHQAQIAKLADGKTIQDVVGALSQNDLQTAMSMLTFAGGPTAIAPGRSGTVGAVLEPGEYIMLCFVSAPDGLPHFAKGMVAGFTVSGTAGGNSLPAGDAQLTLADFSFTGLDSLAAGQHVVHVTNNGPKPHEATVLKLKPGITLDKLRAAVTSPSPVPDDQLFEGPAGGIAAIKPGSEATFDLDLQAGDYAFICFVPDPATQKSHAELGMIAPLSVK